MVRRVFQFDSAGRGQLAVQLRGVEQQQPDVSHRDVADEPGCWGLGSDGHKPFKSCDLASSALSGSSNQYSPQQWGDLGLYHLDEPFLGHCDGFAWPGDDETVADAELAAEVGVGGDLVVQ